MAIIIRKVKNKNATGGFSYVALCAAKTQLLLSDVYYLDDSVHHALSIKFQADFGKEELYIKRRKMAKENNIKDILKALKDMLVKIVPFLSRIPFIPVWVRAVIGAVAVILAFVLLIL